MKELKPKKAFIQKHLNIDRLTSNQWDGILRIMDEYAEHYHDYMQSHPDIAEAMQPETTELKKVCHICGYDCGNEHHPFI